MYNGPVGKASKTRRMTREALEGLTRWSQEHGFLLAAAPSGSIFLYEIDRSAGDSEVGRWVVDSQDHPTNLRWEHGEGDCTRGGVTR